MTPSRDLVRSVLQSIQIPVRIMLRETESGYEADDIILEKMIQSIYGLKDLPIDGFVLGVTKGHSIDRDAMWQLIDACGHHHISFHKAIDIVIDPERDIDFLNSCETIDTILTSGGAVRAADGTDQILRMKSQFRGHIMAAGKILKADVPALHEKLGLNWYHGRAIV
jgi:copper homeostasis protein